MNKPFDTTLTLPYDRLGGLAAGALLAGLLLYQVLPTPKAHAADAEPAAQPAAVEAAKLAVAKSEVPGALPPTAPTPPVPPKAKGGHSNDTPVKELMGMSIGFVAVVMGIGIGMLAIWTEHKKRITLMQLCHQERMAALEKGLELPPFPQEEAEAPEVPGSGLKGGLIWLALGIGLGLFLGFQEKPDIHPALSAIPVALGVAYLLYYAIVGRKLQPPAR